MLAIIPARIGSRGLPMKNMRTLDGLTLVSRAVEFALEMGFETVVTTDSEIIKKEAYSHGANHVVLTHYGYLHSDKCKSREVWRHAWDGFPLERESIFLEPTCPLRKPEDVQRCLVALRNHSSVLTVSRCVSPRKTFILEDNRVVTDNYLTLRQEVPQYYQANGACYAMTRGHVGEIIDNAYAVIIDHPMVSIDVESDFELAENFV